MVPLTDVFIITVERVSEKVVVSLLKWPIIKPQYR